MEIRTNKTIRDYINDILLSADFSGWEYSGGGRESHFRNDEALRGVKRTKRFERLESAMKHNMSSFHLLWTISGKPNTPLYTNEIHLSDSAILSASARKLVVYAASIGRKITLRYTNTDANMVVRYGDEKGNLVKMNCADHLVPFRNAISAMIRYMKMCEVA